MTKVSAGLRVDGAKGIVKGTVRRRRRPAGQQNVQRNRSCHRKQNAEDLEYALVGAQKLCRFLEPGNATGAAWRENGRTLPT
jgi:hypothetical protein